MKFEGPTPETETRHVSLSFAAFIVVAAFVLFAIAMAMGTVSTFRTPDAPQPAIPAPEDDFDAPPAPLPAVTEPEPGTVPEPDSPETAQDDASAQPGDEPAQPQPAQAAATSAAPPAGTTTAAADPAPAETHDASFPTRHAAPKPAAAPAAPVNPVAALLKRKQ